LQQIQNLTATLILRTSAIATSLTLVAMGTKYTVVLIGELMKQSE
jgi:hypothetical protein